MSAKRNFTDQDYELLSAYLDDALSGLEREALEIRLEADPRLQRELDSLRQTVQLINQVPVLRAPRNFTLDATMVSAPPARNIRLFPAAFSALSAAAAVILFMFGGYFLLRQPTAPMSTNSASGIAFAPTASPAPTVFMYATTTITEAEVANDLPEIMLSPDNDEAAMRSMITPEETQVKTEPAANIAGGAAAQATIAEAPADDEQAESSALSEMSIEPPAASPQQDQTGGLPEADTFAAEAVEEAEDSAGVEGETAPADSSPMMHNAPEAMEESTASELGDLTMIAPAPSVAQAPVPQPTMVIITSPPAESVQSDDRLLGIALIAAGLLLFGLAMLTLLYRRRVRA